MSYQENVGSKKGGGGIASESQFNVQRREKIEDLLQGSTKVQYTFQDTAGDHDASANKDKSNPYIFRNHSGKLVCKLCNTMHMSWSSVERHLQGKKHGLNVLRRQQLELAKDPNFNSTSNNSKTAIGKKNGLETKINEYKKKLLESKNNITPKCHIVPLKDDGLLIKVDYQLAKEGDIYRPMIRIMNGYEINSANAATIINNTTNSKEEVTRTSNKATDSIAGSDDMKLIVISNPQFNNVAFEIPSNKRLVGLVNMEQVNCIDAINKELTFWDPLERQFYIQCKLLDDEPLKGNVDKSSSTQALPA